MIKLGSQCLPLFCQTRSYIKNVSSEVFPPNIKSITIGTGMNEDNKGKIKTIIENKKCFKTPI